MSNPDLLSRRLLVVTGKGGVGKTTVTAALALLAAEQGKRVLVVEVDAKGNLTDFFEHRPVGFEPVEVYRGVHVITMDTEASLREYLRIHLRVPVMGRIGPVARAFDFVANAAPGVKEILTIGKIAHEVRESLRGNAPWDLVLVDAAATGHIVAQLGAPETMREFVSVGPVRNQTEWMIDLLSDPAITALNVVATPEEMPVSETIDLVGQVRERLSVPMGAVIVNRVLPELFTHADEEVFESLREPKTSEALDVAVADLTGVGGESRKTAGSVAVLEGARLAVTLRRTRAVHLQRLRDAVDLPLLYLPYVFARDHGMRVTRVIADSLGDELGL
ncbi:MAG: ArsA family ATPase [Actinobacteria bacterium]|nr:ArsA family ATPase [Actinomycetota bacterium]